MSAIEFAYPLVAIALILTVAVCGILEWWIPGAAVSFAGLVFVILVPEPGDD